MKKNKYKNSKGKYRKLLTKDIVGYFHEHRKKILNYKQISAGLNVINPQERKLISELLRELTESGKLQEVQSGKYILKQQEVYITGRVDMAKSGAAYVISDETEDDVYIAPRNTNQSLHGDTVKVFLYVQKKKRKPEGEIIEIVERAQTEFVGVVQVSAKHAFLVPDNRRMYVDIYIPKDKLKDAQNGQKAIVRMTDWPGKFSSPFGEVIKVLGAPGENNVEMHAIMAEFGLPYEFPDNVVAAANKIDVTISEAEIKKRRDFRNILTFTIDPHDAKDFDDALSLRTLENGNIEVGIHIADVSHYVVPGTTLDKEAIGRGNSVYLVDRVVPMLPEVLSNQVCSLRPHEDKLCFSAVFEMAENGKVLKEWFGRTVIHSDQRFTYEEAQAIIEGEHHKLAKDVNTLDKLAKILRKERLQNGALEISSKEVKFYLDELGNPTGVYVKETKDSNKLIEEFMLLANKRVAAFIGAPKKGQPIKPFIYRIHDDPDPERVREMADQIKRFGYKIKLKDGRVSANDLNTILAAIKGTNEEHIVGHMIVRSMSKAIYTTENVGHFGLAFDYYTHFTSPIRRYPDLEVHRLLQRYLDGGKQADTKALAKMAKHCSTTEKKAADAERSSVKFKQVQYMLKSIGEEFEGVISGITSWGIYVEIIENKCEGMIHLRNIEEDYYYYDEKNYQIVGQNRGKTFMLGDKINIRVKSADLLQRQLDFVLAE